MNGRIGPRLIALALGLLVLGVAAQTLAELADVYLKSGVRMRGDVTFSDDAVIIRNAAGEVRVPRADVERIEPVRPPDSQPAGGDGAPPAPGDAASADAAAQPVDPAEEVDVDDGSGLPPMPRLSRMDIQRLRANEIARDGRAEEVRVRFKRRGRERELPAEVLSELRRRPDFNLEWERVLTSGKPHEKLQVILRETGMQHLDRIEIESDPAVFEVFRRRILPVVVRGCARSGCHAGQSSTAFRFPVGTTTSEAYAYAAFVLLDQIQTAKGPLLNRDVPDDSVLLHYMLPPEQTQWPHPAVESGPKFRTVLADREDRNYLAILDWIHELMIPHPDYGLELKNPYAGRLAPARPATTQPAGNARPAEAPVPASQPDASGAPPTPEAERAPAEGATR